MVNTIFSRGLVALAGGAMLSLVSGTLHLWGVIALYVTSYYRAVDAVRPNSEQVGLVFALLLLGQALAQPLCPVLLKNFTPRVICLASGLALSLSLYIASFLTSLSWFGVFYGVAGGIATGVLQVVPITHCYRYFPGAKTTVSCLLIMASGLGNFYLAYLAFSMVNPDNELPSSSGIFSTVVGTSLPIYLRRISYLTFFLTLAGALLLLELLPGMSPREDAGEIEMTTFMNAQFEDPPEEAEQFHPFGVYSPQKQAAGVVEVAGTFNFKSLGSFGVGILPNTLGEKGSLASPLLKKKKPVPKTEPAKE